MITYKIVNNGTIRRSSEDKYDDKTIAKLFPFSAGQPSWVVKALYDYLNLRKTFDIIKFFNTGGELAYKDDLKTSDLKHHASHD